MIITIQQIINIKKTADHQRFQTVDKLDENRVCLQSFLF